MQIFWDEFIFKCAFVRLYKKNDEVFYYNNNYYYFSLSAKEFDYILKEFNPSIRESTNFLRESIRAKDKLQVTPRFLATGNSYEDLSLGRFIPETCRAIHATLKHESF